MPNQVVKDKFLKDLISALLGFSGKNIPIHIKDMSLSLLGSIFRQVDKNDGFKSLYDKYCLSFNSFYNDVSIQGSRVSENGLPEEKSLILHYKIFSTYYASLEHMKLILIPLVELVDLINTTGFYKEESPLFEKYFEIVMDIVGMAYESLDFFVIDKSMLNLACRYSVFFRDKILAPLHDSLDLIDGMECFDSQSADLKSAIQLINDFPRNVTMDQVSASECELLGGEKEYGCEFKVSVESPPMEACSSKELPLTDSALIYMFNGSCDSFVKSSVLSEDRKSDSEVNLLSNQRKETDVSGCFPLICDISGERSSEVFHESAPARNTRVSENGLFSRKRHCASISEVPFEEGRVKKPRI